GNCCSSPPPAPCPFPPAARTPRKETKGTAQPRSVTRLVGPASPSSPSRESLAREEFARGRYDWFHGHPPRGARVRGQGFRRLRDGCSVRRLLPGRRSPETARRLAARQSAEQADRRSGRCAARQPDAQEGLPEAPQAPPEHEGRGRQGEAERVRPR